jgi:hypothetical protein
MMALTTLQELKLDENILQEKRAYPLNVVAWLSK